MAEIIKNKETFQENSATVKQPKAESGSSIQLLSNHQAENSWDRKQLETEVKLELLLKRNVYLGISLKWVQVLKKFSIGYGHKFQLRNRIKYFI